MVVIVGTGEEEGGENGDGGSGEEIDDEWFGGNGHGGGQLKTKRQHCYLPEKNVTACVLCSSSTSHKWDTQ